MRIVIDLDTTFPLNVNNLEAELDVRRVSLE